MEDPLNSLPRSHNFLKILGTSFIGSIFAVTVCNPFDVCRMTLIKESYTKRNQRFPSRLEKFNQIKSSLYYALQLVRRMGLFSYFSCGYINSFKNIALRNGTFFPLYEYFVGRTAFLFSKDQII